MEKGDPQAMFADLENMSGRWVAVKASFPVKPGGYVMRVVVRDGEEQ